MSDISTDASTSLGVSPSSSTSTSGVAISAETISSSGILSGEPASGERYAPRLMTSGTHATGTSSTVPTRQPQARDSRPAVQPKAKQQARALFAKCAEHLELALDNENDFFLRNNELENVKDCLASLWKLRSSREQAYAELINMLQGVFAQRIVEDFTPEQISTLHSVFLRLRDEGVFDDHFANSVSVELLRGDVDIFREIA